MYVNFLKNLYRHHVMHVACTNKWLHQNPPDYRARLRAEVYLRLDILNNDLYDLMGPEISKAEHLDAVHYLICFHTDLSEAQVAQLSFGESLELLLPFLEGVCIPQGVLEYPQEIPRQQQGLQSCWRDQLPLCSPGEWDRSRLMKLRDLYSSR